MEKQIKAEIKANQITRRLDEVEFKVSELQIQEEKTTWKELLVAFGFVVLLWFLIMVLWAIRG